MLSKHGVAIKVGDIVQIDPANPTNPMFGGCFLVVTELKGWGVMGYVQGLGENGERAVGQAYIRLPWAQIEPTGGRAVWTAGKLEEEDEPPLLASTPFIGD